ncbi:MAG: hypothetical protein RDU76_08755 [Candidatus Edwardsbacteria bacterium]|nr:hypothetical protein [Candidatus Edwardsbacteria bacterium]
MKKIFLLVLLLAALPTAIMAQWSTNVNFGWLGNASPDWIESDHIGGDKPFSLWESGWQAGGGLEYRSKDWLAYGVSGSYQSFSAQPSGHSDGPAVNESHTWTGESSWQAPVGGYVRLIKPRAIMGTNLRLGLGVMASHVGQLTVISLWDFPGIPDTSIVAGTGETAYRPFGQASLGIKVPVTRRFGITLDYGFLMTFDRMVMETPLELGLAVGW